jgi:hypothetical protein
LSQRAIRRAQQRRQAAERRRETLRRRRAGLATAAAIGATALFAPAAANAADFHVTTDGDPSSHTACDTTTGDCLTLRDALDDANNNSEDDTITFASVTGAINLAHGELEINAGDGALTITGPGASNLTISGDSTDKSRLVNVYGDSHPINISGLTFTNGYAKNSTGGGINIGPDADVTVADSVFTNNQAVTNGNYSDDSVGSGGAIGSFGEVTVTGSQFTGNHADELGGAIFTRGHIPAGASIQNSSLSGNTAGLGGAIGTSKYVYDGESSTNLKAHAIPNDPDLSNFHFFESPVEVVDTTISDNEAFAGGGINATALLTLTRSTVTGNRAIDSGDGGGIESAGKYAQIKATDSTISNNSADQGGGIGVAQFASLVHSIGSYEPLKHAVNSEITGTTISGNSATYGGGIQVKYLGDGDHFTISHSTISGNDAASSENTGFGGGIQFSSKYGINGEFRTVDATISGNAADVGGGVSAGGDGGIRMVVPTELTAASDEPVLSDTGSIDFENSTIASNSATTQGGGVYLNQYEDFETFASPIVSLTSTIVADNSAAGSANDADRGDDSTSGGLDSSFSLIENPGDAPVIQSPAGSSITGVDPQLGPLADNGGSTQTQLPATSSPAIDKGKAPARLLDDQRGHARTVDGGGVANAASGDGTDIGAVEIDNPAGAPAVLPNAPAGGAGAGDTTPPKITLKVPKSLSIRQLIAGFNVQVKCNEACAMTFRLYASAPTGTLHSAGYNFRLLNKKIGRKGGKRKVHLRPCLAGSPSHKRTKVCRKRITAALFAKPQETFKVKLIVAAKDKAGNLSHRKRFIRIHK